MQKINRNNNWKYRLTYFKYVFISMLRQPYSYIIGLIYLFYLATILLIIPAGLNVQPLYVWSNSSFNFPVFNLIFLAIVNSCLVIAIYRIHEEDGTDLITCSKPVSKKTMWLTKLLVYLISALTICILSIIVAALTGCFGFYSANNLTGIDKTKYGPLMLSMFAGNIVNCLLFGGIMLLISRYSSAIAAMISTISISIVLAVTNLTLSRACPSMAQVLSNKYDAKISSYCLNTANQYLDDNDLESLPQDFVTIDQLDLEKPFDTNEYWTKAKKESSVSALNYIDIGKQLSMFYQIFDLEGSQIDAAKKLDAGASIAYDYEVLSSTGVKNQDNIQKKQYPIGCYKVIKTEGIEQATTIVVGNLLKTGLTTDNWGWTSAMLGLDFNGINFPSMSNTKYLVSNPLKRDFNDKLSYRLSDLKINSEQKQAANNLFTKLVYEYKSSLNFSDSVIKVISNDDSNQFFETGNWEDLDIRTKYLIVSKIQLYWIYYAQQSQIDNIKDYNSNFVYPYSSQQVIEWYNARCYKSTGSFYDIQQVIDKLLVEPIYVCNSSDGNQIFSCMSFQQLSCCETFNNLYKYDIHPYLSFAGIIPVWTIISLFLFSLSIFLYNKKDII